jgi:type II secretory ATPase GspE/PulE/Tfp pilus assembly ATPase PilB-like protein
MAAPADLSRNLTEELDFHRQLSDIVHAIHAAPTIADILMNATEAMRRLLQCERITIYSVDVDTQELYSIVKIEDIPQAIRVRKDVNSAAGFCALSRRSVNIKDAYNEAELTRLHPQLRFDRRWDAMTGLRTTQILAVPILFETYVLGVLQLINKSGALAFSLGDEKAAQEIARSLGIAFYNQNRAARSSSGVRSRYARLAERGVLSAAELDAAVSFAEKYKKDLAAVLMERFRVPKEEIGKALSAFFECPFFADDGVRLIPAELRHKIDPELWRRYRSAPLERKPGVLSVAVTDPFDLNAINGLRSTGLAPRLDIHVALADDIQAFLQRSFPTAEVSSNEPDLAQLMTELRDDAAATEEALAPGAIPVNESDSVIVKLATKIIADAYRAGASDIHVEPNGNSDPCLIRFRRDGDCYVYQEIPPSHRMALVSRLKIMAQLDIAERRKPQDGKIRMRLPDGETIELRVATLPTAGSGNEDVVLRILAASTPIPIDQLGMAAANLAAFKAMIEKPYGLVLCVGPTGSGKTTTLHSALGHLNRPDVKIWTAEDPVEITQKGARQVQVNARIGFTFAIAMRAFLRADPDIVMLGEMRDAETASIGIEAALTGHLVLSTLHTNNAPESITRLLDMGQDPFNFATALLGIVAQRLVRTLCVECKEAYRPDEAAFHALVEAYGADRFAETGVTYDERLQLYRPRGCERCGETGYRGRLGLHEVLVVSDRVRSLIFRRSALDAIRDAAAAEGMSTLLQDGVRKVLDGHTDLVQVRAVCMR